MFEIFFIELRRNILEFYNFRVNILFANLGFVLLFLGLTNYMGENSNITLFLLFTWYCSIHGLDSSSFILEDEIMDRTMPNVISSKTSINYILLIRNSIQLIMDLFKALIIFLVILLLNKTILIMSFTRTFQIFSIIIITIIIMYLIGVCLGSFALVYKRINSIAGILYYIILFFSGIFNDSKVLSFIFPFSILKNMLTSILENNIFRLNTFVLLCLQLIIYLLLSSLLMKLNLKKMFEKGKLFHV